MNKCLKPFFESATGFRSMQAKHNVLIGGPFAYKFMARGGIGPTLCDANVLDYLVVESEHTTALMEYLVQGGYQKDDNPIVGVTYQVSTQRSICLYSSANPITQMHSMKRVMCDGYTLEIRVVVTQNTPLMYVLRERATSCVDFTTWERAYSLFGYQTFFKKVTYPLRHVDAFPNFTNFLRGWQQIGFEVAAMDLSDHCTIKPVRPHKRSLQGKRRVGDDKTWIIPLNTADIAPSPHPSHLLDYASFKINTLDNDTSRWRGSERTFNHYKLHPEQIKHHSLRYSYILPSAEPENRRFEDLTVLMLHSLKPEHLPPGLNLTRVYGGGNGPGPHLDALEGWKPPADSGWKYHDQDMLALLSVHYKDFAPGLKVFS
jgi:hypothetical protein